MPNIKLLSSDTKMFEVDEEILKCSITIKNLLDFADSDNEEPVLLSEVNSAILSKVIEWATYHKNDPSVAEDGERKANVTISSWDADFLKVDLRTLFQIINAANYLEIKGLLDVSCKTVANMIKGKTPNEICKTFNFIQDSSDNNITQDSSIINATQDSSVVNGTEDSSIVNGTEDSSVNNVTQDSSVSEEGHFQKKTKLC